MKKIIRRVGDSVGIIFNKEEQAIHNLAKDTVVDIVITAKKQTRKNQ